LKLRSVASWYNVTDRYYRYYQEKNKKVPIGIIVKKIIFYLFLN